MSWPPRSPLRLELTRRAAAMVISNWVERDLAAPHHERMITTTFGLLLVEPVALAARVQQQAGRCRGSSFGPL